MSRIRPGYLDPHSFDRSVSVGLRAREEPDDDEEEEEEEKKKKKKKKRTATKRKRAMTAIQSDEASYARLEPAYLSHVGPQQNAFFVIARCVYRRLIIQPMNPPTMTPIANVAAVASTGWRFIR